MFKRTLVRASLVAALVAAIGILTACGHAPPETRLDAFEAALAKADHKMIQTPPGWLMHDPYVKVMRMVRHDTRRPPILPPVWKARALTHYAFYLREFSAYGGHGHKGAWFRRRMFIALHQATKADPTYGRSWAALAYFYQNGYKEKGWGKFKHYLARAIRFGPTNPAVQGMRAYWIFQSHGGRGFRAGVPFTGNLGFSSAKWARVFCYRALLYLMYLRDSRPDSNYFWPPTFGRQLAHIALKYYVPDQLAQVEAGTWRPGPCPDPFPPPEKKAASATEPAKQGRKSAGKPAA